MGASPTQAIMIMLELLVVVVVVELLEPNTRLPAPWQNIPMLRRAKMLRCAALLRPALAATAGCGALSFCAAQTDCDARPGYVEVPKEAVVGVVTATAGLASMAIYRLLPKSKKEAEANYNSTMGIAAKLKNALDAAFMTLGEPPLPHKHFLAALKVFIKFASLEDEKDPMHQVTGLESSPGVQRATKADLAAVNKELPLALLAYTADTTELAIELNKLGLKLLYHDPTVIAGERTSHYVAYSTESKRVVIGVQGTSTVDDAITDCVCKPVPLRRELGKVETLMAVKGDGQQAVSHEAMTEAAHHLKERIGPLLRDVFLLSGYTVLVTGHSLGAGTACLLAILLREEVGIPMVKGIGFATPPVVDKKTALASKDYITSVVHNTDCIPRASVRSLAILGTTLKQIHAAIQASGEAAAIGQAKSILLRAIEEHAGTASDFYVPGKVLYIFKDGVGS